MINGIKYDVFLEEFKNTSIYNEIKKDFDVITCTNQSSPLIDIRLKSGLTFRELYGKTGYVVGGETSISVVTLYYLNFLLEKNPNKIYDIGCGWNIWKRYYPQIIGIDSEPSNSYADIIQRFDNNFIRDFRNKIESLMSVNINLGVIPDEKQQFGCIPCTYENYAQQVEYLMQVIKPGGRAYFAISRHGMFKFTPKEWYKENNVHPYDYDKLSNLLLDSIKSLPLDVVSFDCELDLLESVPAFDGCIRLVFDKH